MATNIEVKARAREPEELRRIAAELTGTAGELIVQEDVFFDAPHARLKLRVLSPVRGELIAYRREDRVGIKASQYVIAPITDPAVLREALATALGESVTVRKRRILYLAGQTRIHLDDVERLGWFVELEYVLRADEPRERGEQEVARLLAALGVHAEDVLATAYADLLRPSHESVQGIGDAPVAASVSTMVVGWSSKSG
jgi:predicted adenylyl cyclase CyaB